MRQIDKIKTVDTEDLFIGIVGFNYQGQSCKSLRTHVTNFLKNQEGIIYVSLKSNEIQCKKYLGEICHIDLDTYINRNKLTFITRKNCVKNNAIHIDKFFKVLKDKIHRLNQNGYKKNKVIINIDSIWNTTDLTTFNYFYTKLKTIIKGEDIGFILKYTLQEIDGNHIDCILKNHENILIDKIDKYEFYTTSDLMKQSVTLFSNYFKTNKKHEEEMVRGEFLKNLGEIMEGTVHDINNILTNILGYAQLSSYSKDLQQIKENLETICSTALDGKEIINRIKNYSKDNYDSSKNVYEFNEIILNCISMTKHKFRSSRNNSNSLELITDLKSKNKIFANEYDLRHSIINIILNGVDAMESLGGIMTIRTYDEDERIVLEISDTGKGMDKSIVDKIFDAYFSTKGSKGTGLGLNIVKKKVEKHEGEIHVDSKLDEGTKFTIYFPYVESQDNLDDIKQKSYNIS